MKDLMRNIDSLGRVVLPKEIREANGLVEGDGLVIKVTDEGILLVPFKAHCEMCGSSGDLLLVGKSHICRTCAVRAYMKIKGEGEL